MVAKKKTLMVILAAVGGIFAAKKIKARKGEQDLWSEATSSPDLR